MRLILLAMVALMMLLGGCATPRQPVRLDTERGVLSGGLEVKNETPGHSGGGYVTNFRGPEDKLQFNVTSPGGLYRAVIRYHAPGHKGYELEVNGFRYSGMFLPSGAGFTYHEAGLVELQPGENQIAIYGGWHYYSIDSIDFFPAQPPRKPVPPPLSLSDQSASPAAQALMEYLISQYGTKTLSGVIAEDESYLFEVTGKHPAILGADFMDYSPSSAAFGAKPGDLTDRMLAKAQEGYLITFSWHWRAPKDLLNQMIERDGQKIDAMWYKGFNTNATTFDIQKALVNPQSEDYKLIIRDIDAIAGELKKFSDAGVPVLWRPLHESEGRWFWWGAKGPESFKQLWHLMHDRMTHHHQLHNLIWVYTGTANLDWYPGDGYVDIIGVDAYPSDTRDALSGTWTDLQKQFSGRKLLALSEFGAIPDMARARRFGVYWSYFVPWGGELGPKGMEKDELIRRMNDPELIHHDALTQP